MASPETLVLPTVQPWIPGDAAELGALVEERLPDRSVDVARTPAESREKMRTAEVVVTNELTPEMTTAAERLEWVQALSAGVNESHFGHSLDELEAMDVALTTVSGVHAQPITEQVLCYLLLFERDVLRGLRQQRRNAWERYHGGELRGKTLGVVGLGSIGGRIAELGSAVGMRVVGTKRTPETAPDAVDEVYPPDGLYAVLREADYVVVACPLTPATRGLFGRDEFDTMKADSVFVNVARGGIVDEDALTEAVQNRRIAGAALDVFEEEPLDPSSPLWDLSNVVVTPHSAGLTPAYLDRSADIFARNFERYVETGRSALENRVV